MCAAKPVVRAVTVDVAVPGPGSIKGVAERFPPATDTRAIRGEIDPLACDYGTGAGDKEPALVGIRRGSRN